MQVALGVLQSGEEFPEKSSEEFPEFPNSTIIPQTNSLPNSGAGKNNNDRNECILIKCRLLGISIH